MCTVYQTLPNLIHAKPCQIGSAVPILHVSQDYPARVKALNGLQSIWHQSHNPQPSVYPAPTSQSLDFEDWVNVV